MSKKTCISENVLFSSNILSNQLLYNLHSLKTFIHKAYSLTAPNHDNSLASCETQEQASWAPTVVWLTDSKEPLASKRQPNKYT